MFHKLYEEEGELLPLLANETEVKNETTTTTYLNLFALPPELVNEIFQYLAFKDALTLRKVSSEYKKQVDAQSYRNKALLDEHGNQQSFTYSELIKRLDSRTIKAKYKAAASLKQNAKECGGEHILGTSCCGVSQSFILSALLSLCTNSTAATATGCAYGWCVISCAIGYKIYLHNNEDKNLQQFNELKKQWNDGVKLKKLLFTNNSNEHMQDNIDDNEYESEDENEDENDMSPVPTQRMSR